MINTESELREAIAWFREIGAEDMRLSRDRSEVCGSIDGWSIRGFEPYFYVVANHKMFMSEGGYMKLGLTPWLVARLQK